MLRERLAASLAEGDAAFELLVQRQRDPVTMPVEDATIEWLESRSPFERVATLRLPAQRFDAPDQMAFAEHISFTPWHSLAAHEPVGGINRVRKAVYQAVSRYRHERNGVVRREPASLDIDPILTTRAR
jgi:hypothetical protein